jgi:hypothetical protein
MSICLSYIQKGICWDFLIFLRGMNQWTNSASVRDFNTTLSQKEKKEGSIVRDPFKERMEDFISLRDLVDIKPLKGKCT